MIVGPPKRTMDRPFALVVPGHRRIDIITEAGEYSAQGPGRVRDLLERFAGYVLYCDTGISDLRRTTGALAWKAETWRSRAVRMVLIGTEVSVISLRGTLAGSRDPFGDLYRAIHWLRGRGVSPAGISQMGWNLWRSTLPGPLSIDFDPGVGHEAVFGGRQECREPADATGRRTRTYSNMVAVDLPAAYPTAMASRPYALALRPVDASTVLDPSTSGLARARVLVPPDLPHPPLPVRIDPEIIQWQWGHIEGVWPWCELRAARDVGAEVRVVQSWAPSRSADLFGGWLAVVAEGRNLEGNAKRVVKAVANATWGVFGMRGDDTAEVRWTDDTGDRSYTVAKTTRMLPHRRCAHIAAETAARVRTRLLTEALYGFALHAVHTDTDGVIVRASAVTKGHETSPSDINGVPLNDWIIKQRMAKVEVRAPQVYRYTCGRGCGVGHAKWHYVASGVPPEHAPAVFEKIGKSGARFGVRAGDIVLPPGHAQETAQAQTLADGARALAGAIYGPGLGD